MRILYLTHRLPYPPDKGERIRPFYQLRHFTARHEIDLFCFADSEESAQNQRFLAEMCRMVYVEVVDKPIRLLRASRNFVSGQPVSFGFFSSRKFAKEVRQALDNRNYDVMFVSCSSMGQYIPHDVKVPVLIDFVDADSQKFSQYAQRARFFHRWLYAHEARKVAEAERALGNRATLAFAVTERDARELGGSGPTGFPVEIVANGVQVPEDGFNSEDDLLRELKPFALFLGTMNYPPNSDAAAYFARDIFPLVRRTDPHLKFVVMGRDPDRTVRQLATIPGVVVTGTVPDAFRYFRNADVTVAPFRISQGFHNKIAESLAVGTPVVTTSRVMMGLGLSERDGLFVGDTPEDFAGKVTKVLNDQNLRRELRERARAVARRLSWDRSLSRMEQLITQVASKSACRAGEPIMGR